MSEQATPPQLQTDERPGAVPHSAGPDVVVADVVVTGEALEYHRIQRAHQHKLWRPLLGVLLVGLFGFGVVPVGLLMVFGGVGALLGEGFEASLDAVGDTSDVTVGSMAYLLLSLSLVIPVVWVVTLALNHLRLGWVTSVVGRMRWGYLWQCVGLSVIALFATMAVQQFVPADAVEDIALTANPITGEVVAMAVLILALVPFQASAEEYMFRGYLTQACGGLFANPWLARVVAVVVPAFLFALAHGAQDPPIFFDRFAFGLTAGVLVIVTGGLEAAIAMHVLNNYLAFGLAILFTDLSSALEPTGGTWWSLPGTLTQSLVYLALAWWLARAKGLATTVGRPVLVSPARPV
ncbi:CPBP family intramembrane glutamic endopeptidase [Nocardioides yefusunii]|uniref:CPBP family intramembrane glutamic endopeptidase n=1 Tax=Nocardioides yefusunii TaxID=2500546 RepID=A0ABW1QWM4_9ACTN|nr:CPBP family intramembrane glutamic endopeptidase [Nocardioides yefusunii]